MQAKRRALAKHAKVYPRDYSLKRKQTSMKTQPKVKYDYPGAGRRIGEMVGSFVPLPGASVVGGILGDAAQSLVKKITGFGEYQIQQNTLLEGMDPPQFANRLNGKGTVVRHREYIGDVITSATPGAFKVNNYFIQPALTTSFPWLSGLADQFEQYEVSGMVYEFKTMSADALNSTNTALGSVIMATNYNAAAPNFANKQEMENYEYSSSCKPSSSMLHPIECSRAQSVSTTLYTRSSSVPSGQDQRLYDFANFQIATVGFQGASVNVGELWCTYDIVLLKPRASLLFGNEINCWKAKSVAFANATPLLGLVPVSNITFAMSASGTQLNFPQDGTCQPGQQYILTFVWQGTAATIAYPSLTFTGCVSQSYYVGDTYTSVRAPVAGTSSAWAILQFIVEITDYISYIQFGGSTLPTPGSLDVIVSQIPAQIQA